MIHLFVGPTLAAESILELLPEANLCPPVKHGDLLRLDPDPDDVVAIIDGLFHHQIAIRHKEILDLLARGVQVYGASSMGALRAAELHAFGMVGIGTIFDGLVSGAIIGDDEVSLVHADVGDGYRPLSEALVDIRLHCRQALEAGVVTQDDADAIIAAAGALAYDERAYARVLADARTEHGLEPATSAAYLTFVQREGRSAKREDALDLVRHLQRPSPPAQRDTFELATTHWLHMWRDSQRSWRDSAGSAVSDRVVLNFIRIAARDYPTLHERVVLETLGGFYSEQIGLSVPSAAELLQDFRDDTGLGGDDAWLEWCDEHRLSGAALGESLVRQARLSAATRTSGDVSLARLRQLAGDYAVELGLWPRDELPAAQLAQWLTGEEQERLSSVEQVARVAVRTFRLFPSTPHDGPFMAELKLSGAFARARAALIERPPLPDARASAEAVLAWCAMRWGVDAVTPPAILDRGLGAATAHAQHRPLTGPLAKRAGRFYSRAEASGDFPPLTVA